MRKIKRLIQSILIKLIYLLDSPEERKEREIEKERIMGWFHN